MTFYPIDSSNTFKHIGYYTNILSSSDVTGSVWFYAPTCSVNTFSSSYLSHSTKNSVENLFYSPGSEQYNYQIKDGFYSSSIPRFVYLPYWFKGDKVKKNSFKIYDINTNVTVSDDGNGNLYDTTQAGMIIGNLFYKAGVAVLWEDEQPKYGNICSGANWRIESVSETEIWRKQWVFTIGINELNYSQNPSSVTQYDYRMKGLGAIDYSLKASYVYTGSNPNRSKFADQSGNSNSLNYYTNVDGDTDIATRQNYEYLTTDGLYYPTSSNTSASGYVHSGSIFSTGSQPNRAYLVVSKLKLNSINQGNQTNSLFYLYNRQNITWANTNVFGCMMRQSSGSQDSAAQDVPYAILATKGYDADIGFITWSNSASFSTPSSIKQIAYWLDVDQSRNYLQRGIYVNGTASYTSSIAAPTPTQSKGFNFSTATHHDHFFVSGSTLTASLTPVTSSLISGSIGYVKLFEFAAENKPTETQLMKYLHEEYASGSNDLADENGVYTINPYNNLPPYITTFALCNDDNEPLIVGKFARPIPNDQAVPIVIQTSFDLV